MAALGTLGTSTTTVLPAMQWNSGPNQANFIPDLALLNAGILFQDQYGVPEGGFQPNASVCQGKLIYPGRGWIRLFEGDWIAYDPNTGFPIFINSATAAAASWVKAAAS